jgi:hypothetical protein
MAIEGIRQLAQARAWQGEVPVSGRYTYGVAGERFYRVLKEEGRFVGTHCGECQQTYVPARLYCIRCLADLSSSWADVASTGTLHTWTAVHLDQAGQALQAPVLIGAIQLDGATSLLIHRLGEMTAAQPVIGMRVEAVLRPAAERQGGVNDVVCFRPLS